MVALSTQKELGLSVVEFDEDEQSLFSEEESDDEIYNEKLALGDRRGDGSGAAGKVSQLQLALIYSLHLAEAYVSSVSSCAHNFESGTNQADYGIGLVSLLRACNLNYICSSGMRSFVVALTPSTGPALLRLSSP